MWSRELLSEWAKTLRAYKAWEEDMVAAARLREDQLSSTEYEEWLDNLQQEPREEQPESEPDPNRCIYHDFEGGNECRRCGARFLGIKKIR